VQSRIFWNRLSIILCEVTPTVRSLALVVFAGLLAPLATQAQIKLPNGTDDLGSQINAAAAAMPGNGGKILLQSQPSGQCYAFSTPIVITKPIIIQGQGPSTCLNFAGVGTAVTFAGGNSSYAPGGSYVDGFGLRDLMLLGSGPSGNQTGLLLGGTDSTVGFYATGLTISSFGLGFQFGRGVWNFKMEHSIFGINGQNVHWASSLHFGGENVDFDSVTFVGATFANSVEIDDNTTTDFSNLNNLTFVSCNFDNAQLVINNGAGGIRLYSDHFENAGGNSGTLPFVQISAYTAGTDVLMDGPDFYNDQNNPYPSSFIEIDGGAAVTITQMRSINLDGSTNVPTNVLIGGWATVSLIGNAPLRAAQTQYTIVPGSNPLVSVMGGLDSANQVTSQGPVSFSQMNGPINQSPIVQVGGNGYIPYVGFDLWSGQGSSYYGMRIQQNSPNELDFCSTGLGPAGGGTPNCQASIVNGVFTSNVPEGTPPLAVQSHTPPVNLNAWPATFSPSGAQIQNPHITTGKVILPASGTATVSFQGASVFSQTPACSVSYQTSFQLVQPQALSSNPYPNQIVVFGQPYIGVYFMCLGN
jgi:uncharacterized protein YjbI with pentapeptide repeats